MNKSYIALKAVDENFESLWIGGKLRRKYDIGKTLRFHPDYPGYLISNYGDNWKGYTGAKSEVRRVIVVRVPENHLTTWCPWLGLGYWHDKSITNLKWKTFEQLKPGCTKNAGRGATRMTVLEEIPGAEDMDSLEAVLKFFEFKYQMSRIP